MLLSQISKSPRFRKTRAALHKFASNHFNFYRIHLIYFILGPLITSGIFYASNGDNHVKYIDCLFLCTSAYTVTGLNSVLLAPLTRWQQVILYICMCLGSLTSISLVTILIRRHFFRQAFANLVKTDPAAQQRVADIEAKQVSSEGPFMHKLWHPTRLIFDTYEKSEGYGLDEKPERKRKKSKPSRLNIGMIRKVDDEKRMQQIMDDLAEAKAHEASEVVADPPVIGSAIQDEESGSELSAVTSRPMEMVNSTNLRRLGSRNLNSQHATFADGTITTEHHYPHTHEEFQTNAKSGRSRRLSEGLPTRPVVRDHVGKEFIRVKTLEPASATSKHFPRSTTIEFADDDNQLRRRRPTNTSGSMPRTRTAGGLSSSTRHEGFGGFPNPIFMIPGLVKKGMERTKTMNRTFTNQSSMQRQPTLQRNLTMQRTGTVASGIYGEPKPVPYISFDAVVGRNSHFKKLTNAQEEELGGVEYRALSLLAKIVAAYWLGFQLIACLMIAPYLSTSRFDYIFDAPGGNNPTWYTFFNVWSAFSNNGMSLLDSSMIPFQSTYFWIIVLSTMILAGNTCFPVFLRASIWVFSKVVPSNSRIRDTLQFLLDHPRRSFLYLFPSYQTWFLLFIVLVLTCTDWFCFLILDIGNAELEAIPLHTRVIDGLFQATAVRAAGFAIINLADIVPALQVLYVIMMYIAVYPIALSVRSTNVYEEQSMGIFDTEDDESALEAEFSKGQHAGSYIAYHARKQLAFDLWWLVLALFCICIVERDNIQDPSTDSWFNVFTVIFELTSAYGTVGLSLGSPVTGTSLCGSFRTLSKLILVAVMIRGRHRGLPNAIDRAVLLPTDMNMVENNNLNATGYDAERRSMRRNSTLQASGLPRTRSKSIAEVQPAEESSDDEYSDNDGPEDTPFPVTGQRPRPQTGSESSTSKTAADSTDLAEEEKGNL